MLLAKVFGAGAEDTAEYDHSVTVMTIYSESDENIEAAVKMIEAYARREIINKTMEDDSITKLSQEQVNMIFLQFFLCYMVILPLRYQLR